MHIAGIVENGHTQKVIDAIKYFLHAENKKISVTEYAQRFTNRETWRDYLSALMQIEIEVLVIRIKIHSLEEALEALPFETLIVNEYTQWEMIYPRIRDKVKKSIDNMVVILNSDVIKSAVFSDEKRYRTLCYGFNSDSSVTTSSTGEPSISGQFLCCVREKLISANGRPVEPQEFVLNLQNMTGDPYSILAAASFAVLQDIDLNKSNM